MVAVGGDAVSAKKVGVRARELEELKARVSELAALNAQLRDVIEAMLSAPKPPVVVPVYVPTVQPIPSPLWPTSIPYVNPSGPTYPIITCSNETKVTS